MSINHTPHILLADDHVIIRNGLEMLLSSIRKRFIFNHASNKAEIFEKLNGKWKLVSWIDEST